MGIWKGFCSACGAVGCGIICVATGGLAAPAILTYSAVAGGLGFFVGDKIDSENEEREKRLMENERYRDGVRAAENQFKENQNTKAMLTELFGKKNGTIPLKQGETQESIDEQIAILTNTLKQGEDKYNQMLSDLNTMRKELLGGTNLMKMLGLDKMKTMDQIMLIGGVVLLIVLLKK